MLCRRLEIITRMVYLENVSDHVFANNVQQTLDSLNYRLSRYINLGFGSSNSNLPVASKTSAIRFQKQDQLKQ